MNKATAIILALVAPFIFPTVLTGVIVLLAAVVVPPVGILAGVLIDVLYYTPAVSLPYGTLTGAVLTGVGYVMHQFIKTRIISA